jgi:hypothetical protein
MAVKRKAAVKKTVKEDPEFIEWFRIYVPPSLWGARSMFWHCWQVAQEKARDAYNREGITDSKR